MTRINESTREKAISCAKQIAADPSAWLRRIASAIDADTTSKDLYVEIIGIAVGIQNEKFKRHPTNDTDCLIVKLQAEDGRPAVKIVEHFHDAGKLSAVRFNFGDDYASTLLALRRSYGIDSVAIAYDPQNVMAESIKYQHRKPAKMNESSYGWDPPKKIQKFCTIKDLYYELRKCKFQGFGNGKCDIPVVVGQNEMPTSLQPGPDDFHVFFTGEWTDEQIEDMINRDEGNPGDSSVEARINTIESEYDAERDRDGQLVEVYYSDDEWQAKKPHYVTRIDWNADTFILVTV